MRVPPISNLKALEYVLRDVKLFSTGDERRQAVQMLGEAGFAASSQDESIRGLHIGIKKLLSIIEMARQEPDKAAERLVSAVMNL